MDLIVIGTQKTGEINDNRFNFDKMVIINCRSSKKPFGKSLIIPLSFRVSGKHVW